MATLKKAAGKMRSASKNARPATGGNKNVRSSARGKSASSQKSRVAGTVSRNLKGPGG